MIGGLPLLWRAIPNGPKSVSARRFPAHHANVGGWSWQSRPPDLGAARRRDVRWRPGIRTGSKTARGGRDAPLWRMRNYS